jgi:light-regulated signal transduction histidine kinase (bacteriophytochrome)
LWVLVTGLLVTVLAALCFLMGLGRTLRIERLVAERTQQLRTVNDSLEAEIAESKRVQVEKESLLSLLSEANNELIDSNDKLKQSNQELEDFAYVASHDLQEPLRKVTAFGDRLKAGYSDVLDETARDYVDRMQNAARRMSTLINDMLTYSRVSSKAQPFVEVDLDETVREVLEDFEVRIEELNATVDVGPLPCVQADGLQMRQLMQNLISNALKFHKPDTSPTVKIYSRPVDEDATASGSAVEVVVEDDGIGFDEKYTDQIFRMFQRLHGRNEYEGTGVGLAVCRKIADRHGVAISVRSISGQGAEFALRFACDSILSQSTVTN